MRNRGLPICDATDRDITRTERRRCHSGRRSVLRLGVGPWLNTTGCSADRGTQSMALRCGHREWAFIAAIDKGSMDPGRAGGGETPAAKERAQSESLEHGKI